MVGVAPYSSFTFSVQGPPSCNQCLNSKEISNPIEIDIFAVIKEYFLKCARPLFDFVMAFDVLSNYTEKHATPDNISLYLNSLSFLGCLKIH